MSKLKKKTEMGEMVRIFDSIWKNNPRDAAATLIRTWPGICKENGWTGEEFDEELYEWQKERFAKKTLENA